MSGSFREVSTAPRGDFDKGTFLSKFNGCQRLGAAGPVYRVPKGISYIVSMYATASFILHPKTPASDPWGGQALALQIQVARTPLVVQVQAPLRVHIDTVFPHDEPPRIRCLTVESKASRPREDWLRYS